MMILEDFPKALIKFKWIFSVLNLLYVSGHLLYGVQ